MPREAGCTPSDAQVNGLRVFWDNPTKYKANSTKGTRAIATRVFLDAVEAIQENGSSRAYFENLAKRDPRAFMSFLGKSVARLLTPDTNLELDVQRVARTPDEIRERMLQRGLTPEFMADLVAPSLMAEKQAAEARALRAEAELEQLRRASPAQPTTPEAEKKSA